MKDSKQKEKDKKKKRENLLEKELFSLMQKSLKAALDAAIDDLLKSWK